MTLPAPEENEIWEMFLNNRPHLKEAPPTTIDYVRYKSYTFTDFKSGVIAERARQKESTYLNAGEFLASMGSNGSEERFETTALFSEKQVKEREKTMLDLLERAKNFMDKAAGKASNEAGKWLSDLEKLKGP